MCYAQIKNEWFKASDNKRFFVSESKEGRDDRTAQVYVVAEDGHYDVIASVGFAGKSEPQLVEEIKDLVTRHGFQPSNGPQI